MNKKDKKVKKRGQRDLPTTPEMWVEEIRAAYADAQEAMPFGIFVGAMIKERDLFRLAPAITLKFRGLPSQGADLDRARDAALSSYVVNEDRHGDMLSDPRIAFGFCYLASHFGLGLVEMAEVDSLMAFIEQNKGVLNDSGQPRRSKK